MFVKLPLPAHVKLKKWLYSLAGRRSRSFAIVTDMPSINYFKDLTLLVTHYNRSDSLYRLLQSFKDSQCTFEDIVVSDDGSSEQHLNSILKLQADFGFRLISSPINKGLAHNLNKGQNAVNTLFTLYIQEDFVPSDTFAEHLADAVNLIREKADLDIIRFYAYRRYPYLIPYKKGFSEMIIKPWHLNYYKVHFYSDHPHLRRSTFLQKFGKYQEGIKGDRAEYRMCLSFIQKKGKGLFFDDYKSLFTQRNSEAEPSTMSRRSWTNSQNLLVRVTRYIYRQLKYNYDILFFRIP
ncbi:glycosyltransferase [Daejeonella sp.]